MSSFKQFKRIRLLASPAVINLPTNVQNHDIILGRIAQTTFIDKPHRCRYKTATLFRLIFPEDPLFSLACHETFGTKTGKSTYGENHFAPKQNYSHRNTPTKTHRGSLRGSRSPFCEWRTNLGQSFPLSSCWLAPHCSDQKGREGMPKDVKNKLRKRARKKTYRKAISQHPPSDDNGSSVICARCLRHPSDS